MSLSRRDFLKASASVGSAAMLANRLRMVSRGTITPFTPDQVTGIYAWYRADLGTYQTVSGSAATADGDPVGEWQDQSGSALHVTQGTAGNRPTLQLSELYGRPVLRFDGTNDYLQAAAAADWKFLHDGSDFLALVVWKSALTNPNTDYGLLDTGGMASADTGFALNTSDTSPRISTMQTTVEKGAGGGVHAALAAPVNGSVAMGEWHISAAFRRAGGELTIHNDGHWGGDDSGAYSSPSSSNPTYPLTIAARGNGTQFRLAGDIAEVILYDASVSEADYKRLLTYLRRRYGLRPFRWFDAADILVSDGAHNAFPSLCIAANGDLVVAYRKGTGHDSGDGDIVVVTSDDDGATWSAEQTILTSASYDYRFCGLTTLSTGRIIGLVGRRQSDKTEVTTGVRVVYSDDDGATWTGEIAVGHNYTLWAREGGKILEMPNGDLLMPLYGQDSGDTGANARVRLSKSTDGGDTWAHLAQVVAASNGWYEPGLVYYEDTDVLQCLIRYNSTAIYLSASDGTAASWTAPAQIAEYAEGLQSPTLLRSGEVVSIVRSDITLFYPTLFYTKDRFASCQTGHLFEEAPDGAEVVYGAVAEDERGIFVVYATENNPTSTGDAGVMFVRTA